MLTLGKISCPHYEMVPKDLAANLVFRHKMLKMASEDESTAAQFLTMCEEDMLFYINTFCWTYAPKDKNDENPVVPFNTYAEFQDEAMLSIADCIMSGRDFAMPKSRDMGASWIGLTVFEWFWHFRDNLSFLLISRNEDYVDKKGNPKSLFWKIDFLHKYQPRWLLPTGRWLGDKDPNRQKLHLTNEDTGSVLDGESTTGDAGRGDRRTAMFIDEHAAFDLDAGYQVLRATRDTTKCRGFNSTPQGSNNAFFDVVHETSARIIRLHWSDHPLKNKGLYKIADGEVELLDDYHAIVEVQRKGEKDSKFVTYPDDYPFIMDEEFPLRSPWFDNECSRCVSAQEIGQELEIDFLGSDYQFFDATFINIIRKKYCMPPRTRGVLEYDGESCTPKRFTEEPRGNLFFWIQLTQDGKVPADRKFVVGSDVSAGTGASNSVSSVVDGVTGEKAGVLITPVLRPTPFASMSIALAKFFNKAFMIWDASGPTGNTFGKQVIRKGYRNIHYRRNEKKIGQPVTDEPGYYLTPKARENLLEDYREALSSHRFINHSDRGMKECLQFIRKADGTVEHSEAAHSLDPSGARTSHGDEVIADALASKGIEERATNPVAEKPEVPVGSLAWRRELKVAADKLEHADTLDSGWGR